VRDDGNSLKNILHFPNPTPLLYDTHTKVYLLLGSLIGCEQATATFVARAMKIKVESLSFDLTAVRDERGALSLPISQIPPVPSRLTSVTGSVLVKTTASQNEVEELGHQVHHRCPIANMMALSGCQVNIEWKKA
jgi:uncharacterized OsmC-like protein